MFPFTYPLHHETCNEQENERRMLVVGQYTQHGQFEKPAPI
jgi:hypothetical protein